MAKIVGSATLVAGRLAIARGRRRRQRHRGQGERVGAWRPLLGVGRLPKRKAGARRFGRWENIPEKVHQIKSQHYAIGKNAHDHYRIQ